MMWLASLSLVLLAALPLWLPASATAWLSQERSGWMRRQRLLLLGVLLVLVAAAAETYRQLGAAEDVRLAGLLRQFDGLPAEQQPAAWTALAAEFRARLVRRPDNTGYLRLLAEDAAWREDWPEAARHYSHLARLAGGNPEVAAMAMTARFMADGRRISTALRADMESVLALAPEQPSVRGMLGMQAFESADYALAIEHWQWALRGLSADDPVAASLRVGIQRARQALQGGSGDTWLKVHLAVEGGGDYAADTPVFVFVSRAEGSMPLAARRLRLADLPLTLELGSGDALQGADLRSAGAVRVAVRLARAGTVQAGTDDPEVHSVWFEAAAPPEHLAMTLRLPPPGP